MAMYNAAVVGGSLHALAFMAGRVNRVEPLANRLDHVLATGVAEKCSEVRREDAAF